MTSLAHWPFTTSVLYPNPYSAELILYKTWRSKGLFQFEILINVLASSSCFIWISMLWVYGQYKYFNSSSAGTVFIRQNLTSTDVRFWHMKTVPALKELKCSTFNELITQSTYKWTEDCGKVVWPCVLILFIHCEHGDVGEINSLKILNGNMHLGIFSR